MIGVVVRVMWLSLWRDRGALLLAFVLPPLMFFVFAEVFSGTGADDLVLRVEIVDEVDSQRTRALTRAFIDLENLEVVQIDPADEADLLEAVRGGRIDALVRIRAEPGDDLDAPAPIVVISDAARGLAGPVVTARLQAMLQRDFVELGVARAAALVDVLAGPYTARQREDLDLALVELAGESSATDDDASTSQDGLIEQRTLARSAGGQQLADDGGISYYAGAVAILFLLFSGMQGAISLIDERTSGIKDRLVAGPGGYPVVVAGKGLFLTGQGVAQATVIFAFAGWMYGIDWIGNLGPWLVTTLLAAACAAGLGLLLASLCRSRQQAQTASAFAVLILSAIGGSMMPRFLMPGWLRDLGWITPNAWAIEAWQGIFWRGDSLAALAPAWGVLALVAAVSMAASLWLAGRSATES